MNKSPFTAPSCGTAAMEIANIPPRRKRGAEISLGRRYAMMVERAMAIPPGKTSLPKGTVAPLAQRYGVGPEYATKLWKNCKAQIEDTQELDLSNKPRSGRPSLLTPTKAVALQNLFKVYSQTLRKSGDNNFRVEHTGVKSRQRAGTLERVVKYDAEALNAAWDYLASSDSED